jgi:hypothetical protein
MWNPNSGFWRPHSQGNSCPGWASALAVRAPHFSAAGCANWKVSCSAPFDRITEERLNWLLIPVRGNTTAAPISRPIGRLLGSWPAKQLGRKDNWLGGGGSISTTTIRGVIAELTSIDLNNPCRSTSRAQASLEESVVTGNIIGYSGSVATLLGRSDRPVNLPRAEPPWR